jgi:hypothetical protein
MHKLIPLVLLALACCALSAQDINDSRYGFTAKVPPDFKPMLADRPKTSPDTIHAFYKGNLNDDHPNLVIGIETLGGTIGREGIDLGKMPLTPGARANVETTDWKGFEVALLVMFMSTNGHDMVSLVAQIPLRREAIQVIVAGPRSDEAVLRSYLAFMLDNLQGESNWLGGSERVGRLVIGLVKLGGFLVVVAVIIIVIVRSVSKQKPPGYPPPYPPQQGYPYPPPHAPPYPPQPGPHSHPQQGQPPRHYGPPRN